MKKQFIEIEEATFSALEKIAHENGYESVEKLLGAFAENFSTGCSVTLNASRRMA